MIRIYHERSHVYIRLTFYSSPIYYYCRYLLNLLKKQCQAVIFAFMDFQPRLDAFPNHYHVIETYDPIRACR